MSEEKKYLCPYCKIGIMFFEIMHGGLECSNCDYYTVSTSKFQGERDPIEVTVHE